MSNTEVRKTDQIGESASHARYLRLIRFLGRAIARLLRVTDKPVADFISAYKAGALDVLLQENPQMPISQLSMRSGIDRRQISHYLKQKQINEREKRNKLVMILGELERLVRSDFPDRRIPRYGNKGFDQVCKTLAGGDFSSSGILRELQRLGNVIDHGDSVELISAYIAIRDETADFLQLVTWIIDQSIQTALYNRETRQQSLRNFQRVIYSTQIPYEKRAQVHAELKQCLASHYQQVHDILSRHEAPVASGTFAPLGVCLFQLGQPHDVASGSVRPENGRF